MERHERRDLEKEKIIKIREMQKSTDIKNTNVGGKEDDVGR